jgi:hypothetical protein
VTDLNRLREEYESGDWLNKVQIPIYKNAGELLLALKRHFQEIRAEIENAEAAEATKVEVKRHELTQKFLLSPPTLEEIAQYKEEGWSITRRAKKSVDLDGFLDEYGKEIPDDARGINKKNLTPFLKKELTKYESITEYTYSVRKD